MHRQAKPRERAEVDLTAPFLAGHRQVAGDPHLRGNHARTVRGACAGGREVAPFQKLLQIRVSQQRARHLGIAPIWEVVDHIGLQMAHHVEVEVVVEGHRHLPLVQLVEVGGEHHLVVSGLMAP